MGQYIGARYVPRFMGTYDATQNYEALDVVDNGLGTSYISKIPTPAGTPLTDTTHWAIYGATSGAIINLQNQIDDMKDANVAGSLQNQISANTTDISNLTTRVDNIENPPRVFAIIADSYGTIPSETRGFFDQIESMLTAAGYTFYTRGSGGTGFSKVGTDGTFYQEFLILEQSFSDPSEITDIVILGGSNDVTESTSDVVQGYNTLKSYFDTNYPNARVYCAYTGYGTNISSSDAYQRGYLKTLSIMADLCGQFDRWRMIEGIEYIMHAYHLLGTDHNHPNATGATYMGKAIAGSLINDCNFDFKLTSDVTFKMGNGAGVTGVISFNNANVTIDFPSTSIGGSDTYNFPTTGLVNIGTYTPLLVNNKGKKFGKVVRASSTQTSVFSGYAVLYEGRIDWESLNTTALTSQTGVSFEPMSFVFDTLSV